MKIDRFIVVCILFSHFLTAQENYVSPIREGNKPCCQKVCTSLAIVAGL